MRSIFGKIVFWLYIFNSRHFLSLSDFTNEPCHVSLYVPDVTGTRPITIFTLTLHHEIIHEIIRYFRRLQFRSRILVYIQFFSENCGKGYGKKKKKNCIVKKKDKRNINTFGDVMVEWNDTVNTIRFTYLRQFLFAQSKDINWQPRAQFEI